LLIKFDYISQLFGGGMFDTKPWKAKDLIGFDVQSRLRVG